MCMGVNHLLFAIVYVYSFKYFAIEYFIDCICFVMQNKSAFLMYTLCDLFCTSFIGNFPYKNDESPLLTKKKKICAILCAM